MALQENPGKRKEILGNCEKEKMIRKGRKE